jgi:hypothetical protein
VRYIFSNTPDIFRYVVQYCTEFLCTVLYRVSLYGAVHYIVWYSTVYTIFLFRSFCKYFKLAVAQLVEALRYKPEARGFD